MLRVVSGKLKEALRHLEKETPAEPGAAGQTFRSHVKTQVIRNTSSVRQHWNPGRSQLLRIAGPAARRGSLPTGPAAMAPATQGQHHEADLIRPRVPPHSWSLLPATRHCSTRGIRWEDSVRTSIMSARLEKRVKNNSVDQHQDMVNPIEAGETALAEAAISSS